jgi:hypothetical protein
MPSSIQSLQEVLDSQSKLIYGSYPSLTLNRVRSKSVVSTRCWRRLERTTKTVMRCTCAGNVSNNVFVMETTTDKFKRITSLTLIQRHYNGVRSFAQKRVFLWDSTRNQKACTLLFYLLAFICTYTPLVLAGQKGRWNTAATFPSKMYYSVVAKSYFTLSITETTLILYITEISSTMATIKRTHVGSLQQIFYEDFESSSSKMVLTQVPQTRHLHVIVLGGKLNFGTLQVTYIVDPL